MVPCLILVILQVTRTSALRKKVDGVETFAADTGLQDVIETSNAEGLLGLVTQEHNVGFEVSHDSGTNQTIYHITKSVNGKARGFIIIDQTSGTGRRAPNSKKNDEMISEPCPCFAAVTGSIEKWCTGASSIDTKTISCNKHGANLLESIASAGYLAAGFAPPAYANSGWKVKVSDSFPSIAEIKEQIRNGNPVVFGVEQEYKSGGTGNHAIVAVGYESSSGTHRGILVADPWRGEFQMVSDFPTDWNRRSQTKLPAGYDNWYITKAGFTKPC